MGGAGNPRGPIWGCNDRVGAAGPVPGPADVFERANGAFGE